MPGLGYRAFSAGEVLTATNLQGYAVDQSVMYFETSAARTSALAAPSQGMVSFLNDTGTLWQYFGTYNASTNPGGATTAGWYPISGAAMFFATATRTAANAVNYSVGASGFTYSEIIDPLAWHSAVTNTDRITPNIAGVYRVTGNVSFANNATNVRRTEVLLNGTTIGTGATSSTYGNNVQASVVVQLNGTTDYFTVTGYQDSGSSLTATARVSVEFLRPAQA
jgi:hypothetical protein